MANESLAFVAFEGPGTGEELQAYLDVLEQAGNYYTALEEYKRCHSYDRFSIEGRARGRWEYTLNLDFYFAGSLETLPPWAPENARETWVALVKALQVSHEPLVVTIDDDLESGEQLEVVCHIQANSETVEVQEISRVTQW